MLVADFEKNGILVPYDQMPKNTVAEVKSRLLDAVVSLIGGAFAVDEAKSAALKEAARAGGDVRPVWPAGMKTSLEMAGFLNGFYLRNADWGDTYRREGGGVGGRPGDAVAAVLALCEDNNLSGERILELTHLSYQMWANIQNHMLAKRRDLDYTTTLSLIVPVLTAVCNGASTERIQNALNFSAASGAILEQVRTGQVTNLKSGATAYAIARGIECYRFSTAIDASYSIFDGKFGWNTVYAPFDGAWKGSAGTECYHTVETKTFACYNCAQSALELAVKIAPRLAGKAEEISAIRLKMGADDIQWTLRPGQSLYPSSASDADHNIRYCVCTALVHGVLTPQQYGERYLQDEQVHRLISLMEVVEQTAEEANELQHQSGSCILEITRKDGTTERAVCAKPAGIFTGLSEDEREEKTRALVELKLKMLEKASGFHLEPIARMIDEIEKYNGKSLITCIHACCENN
ncbi:MAG: MmgE/PrpD family protein [Lachnospiraceae bacterium]|nr:MmgE/PrpD family protein [Lachnospiraceae bacterium]